MESIEASSQSFVIKIWLEDSGAEGARARWRGHITHVPSSERRYVENLGQITDFIAHYLELMGVRLEISSRLRRKFRFANRVKKLE